MTMSMRVRITAVAFAFAVLPAAAGCSSGGNAPNPASSPTSASAASSPSSSAPGSAPATAATPAIPTDTTLPGRWPADALAKAFTAINQKIGADPADYLEADLTGVSVAVKAINPQKRQNVDEYTYDGTFVKVSPVDVSSSDPGAVQESAFKSDTIKPDVLVKVMNSAANDSGQEGVHVEGAQVKKFLADDPAPQIDVEVSGPRASKVVEYDMNGQLQKVV